MTTEISLDQQIPPVPDATSEPGAGHPGIPEGVRYRRFRAWLRYWRVRLAKSVMLPELSFTEAQELRQSVRNDGELTRGFILMSALSAGIATLGLLQSSTAVVIGAMLISPLMSPIAALGFGFASIDGQRIREAARVVAVGAGIGILTGVLLTWLSPIRNATPEILARTQPTLLDLAVALFSGVAGGYATAIRKGGTAIGVAIATALMPPLAVVGYGLGVLQIQFALGALLLFLTNLAAITFSFAMVARLSGAARPLYKVEWKPRFVAFGVGAFLVLAVPLSMTLMRLSYEASMRAAANVAILKACGGEPARIAQLDVSWPLFGDPRVDALVVTPNYAPNAQADAQEQISASVDDTVTLSLQQVLAADLRSQTRAMVDAAMARTIAGIAADVPPYDVIRSDIGLPTRSIWTNSAERMVYVEPVPAPEWTLADYAEVEKSVRQEGKKWTVHIVPPPQSEMRVNLDPENPAEGAMPQALAVWALQRWGMTRVTLDITPGKRADALVARLKEAGITGVPKTLSGELPTPPEPDAEEPQTARIRVYSPSPSQRAAAAAAAAAAAEAARLETEEADNGAAASSSPAR